MSLIELERDQRNNPLDVVEHMAAGNNWPFERAGEDEIALVVTGRWTNYQVSFTWMSEIEALHLACAFDMKVPELRLAEVQQLVALINEQMWIGHFDVWMQNGVVMFRHALVLAGGVAASGRQCEAVLASALDSCERYFPAFQFVVWAGKSAREAMDSAMFETPARRRPPGRPRQRRNPCPGHAFWPSRLKNVMAGQTGWPDDPGMTAIVMSSDLRPKRPTCAISPACSFWSAPARWAAPCSKAGCGSVSIRASSPCSSRSRAARSRRWQARRAAQSGRRNAGAMPPRSSSR